MYQKHSPAHGAMLIAGECKRRSYLEMTVSERQVYMKEKANSEKELFMEYRCCSKQDCNGKDDSKGKCCYELYQSGEGKHIQHHLEMNTATVIRDAMKPAFEAAKASIKAGSSSEEIAKAVLQNMKEQMRSLPSREEMQFWRKRLPEKR